jgi:sugar porter (SP) family MFS transporter
MTSTVLRDVLPKRDKWWFQYNSLLNLNLLLLGCIAADITNGYDGSMLNGLQIIPQWQEYFAHPAGSRLGLITNGTRIGQVGALFVVNPLIERLGRKKPIAIGSVIMLVGIAVQTAATDTAMFVIGRVLIGFGNNIQQSACPILLSELAYPSQRPQLTGILNSTGSLGQIMAAWITYGTAGMLTSWSWRLPSLLQALSSIFQLIMVFFMPESPRWLVYNNYREEARQILCKYHAEGDENSELLAFEMAEIDYQLELEKTNAKSSWMEWFRTPANRHRFFVIVSLAFLIQWCGNALVSYYLHLVLNSIGVTNTKTQLLINGGYTIEGLVFGMSFSLLIDKVGRRKMFLSGMVVMFIAYLLLTIFTGVNASHNFSNAGLSGGTIAMIYIFGIGYKLAGPTQEPYYMEISPYNLRAKTSVLKQFGDAGANLFSGFVNPIALDAISWKYYIVWCCMLVSNFMVIYFFYPETKGLSLEEVTQMLDGKAPGKNLDEEEQSQAQKATVETVEDVNPVA